MTKQRSGMVVKKIGMTTLFSDAGEACPVTLFSLEGCQVIRSVTHDTHGMVQVGSGKAKNVTKPMAGHFLKNDVEARQVLREFRVSSDHVLPAGSAFQADYFAVGHCVDVTGVTIGRGFAGVMKRHNFGGLRASHGVSVSHRSHGSTGHRKDPSKVFKGKKMAGHMGCQRVTVQNLRVMECDVERGLIVVKGNVPGFEGGWVMMRDSVKKKSHPKQPTEGLKVAGSA
jgi:large subunit ribosomal protein L3